MKRPISRGNKHEQGHRKNTQHLSSSKSNLDGRFHEAGQRGEILATTWARHFSSINLSRYINDNVFQFCPSKGCGERTVGKDRRVFAFALICFHDCVHNKGSSRIFSPTPPPTQTLISGQFYISASPEARDVCYFEGRTDPRPALEGGFKKIK